MKQLQVVSLNMRPTFSPTANNGKITKMKDWVTGEEVNYAYDALNRLLTAATTGSDWGQAYRTWADSFSNAAAVFGTNLGAGRVNGSADANLASGAKILADLYKTYGDDAAGYYRTGVGNFVKTRKGQDEYKLRQGTYNKHKDALKELFGSNCFK